MNKIYLIFRLIIGFLFLPFFIVCGQEGWTMKHDLTDPVSYHHGGVANGMIGITSSFEPLKVGSTILGGLYEMLPRTEIVTSVVDESISTYIKGFNFLNGELEIDELPMTSRTICNHRQELKMKEGIFCGSFDNGQGVEVEYTFAALRQLPYSGIMHITLKTKKDVEITFSNVLETPQGYAGCEYEFNNRILDANFKMLTGSIRLANNAGKLSATTSLIFEDEKRPEVLYRKVHPEKRALAFTYHLKAGIPFSFAVVGTTLSTATNEDPANYSKRVNLLVGQTGAEKLLEKHIAEWAKLWEGDILIEGDKESQLHIRSMLYYLYSSVREGSGMSIPPMGLFGTYYYGHIFWDADLWVLPVILTFHPEMAKSMIEYRFKRLDAARRSAYAHGYKGAMYPWESAEYGIEDTSPNLSCGPFENHVTACVALAAWNYYCVTQDKGWLRETGYPIIKETADFWLSRVTLRHDGCYDILNVTAPDEHANNVDNDAFTNGSARRNLEIATQAARLLDLQPRKEWHQVSSRIVIEKFPDGITREHSTYNGEMAKQADVSLLTYPLGIVTDKEQMKKDLTYYQKFVIQDGPAMTHSIFSILHARLNDPESAFKLFRRAYLPNYIEPFGLFSETPGSTGRTYFTTGAGGTLQAVMMGFGGLEITPHGIRQGQGVLPSSWKSLIIKGVGPEKKTYNVCGFNVQ